MCSENVGNTRFRLCTCSETGNGSRAKQCDGILMLISSDRKFSADRVPDRTSTASKADKIIYKRLLAVLTDENTTTVTAPKYNQPSRVTW